MKTVCLLLLCLILLAGCQSLTVPPVTTVPAQTTAPAIVLDRICLGMTPAELLVLLDSVELSLEMPDYNETPIPGEVENPVQDGRIYNLTDLSFTYHTADWAQYFTFSYEGELVRYGANSSDFSTHKGLYVGDSVEKMKTLYGTDFQKDVEDYPVYQYRLENGYLNIFYEGDTVTSWCVSAYPNINND